MNSSLRDTPLKQAGRRQLNRCQRCGHQKCEKRSHRRKEPLESGFSVTPCERKACGKRVGYVSVGQKKRFCSRECRIKRHNEKALPGGRRA